VLRPSSFRRKLVYLAVVAVCSVALLILGSVARAGMNTGRTEPTAPLPTRSTQASYAVEAGLEGDIFPVFANFASLQNPLDRSWGTITVTVSNSTPDTLRNRIAVSVPGWSDEEIQIAEVAAGQVHKFQFAPSFLPRLYRNRELTAATALVKIADTHSNPVYTVTVPLRIRSAEDMFWGSRFKYAPFIASWVTPHDPRVEQVLSRAKEFVPGRRLAGYETGKTSAQQERSTLLQVQAIYRALQQAGLSYVKSSSTFGARRNAALAERVRLPNESLRHISANCIDGVVLYASLFENLGMDPVVVLVPGHAYVGVRLTENSSDYLYLETALTGRDSFAAAVRAAQRGMARYPASNIIRVDINQARQAGIFPLPTPQPHEKEEQLAVGELKR
jgi:hypothetical protein